MPVAAARGSRTKRAARRRKGSFVLDWGTFQDDTLVLVGLGHSEWEAAAKKVDGAAKGFVDWVKKAADNCYEAGAFEGTKGFFYHDTSPWTILCFPEWNGTWEDYGTLMHELHHAVHYVLGERRHMKDEMEALAYQQEFLFSQCRRKLNDLKPETNGDLQRVQDERGKPEEKGKDQTLVL